MFFGSSGALSNGPAPLSGVIARDSDGWHGPLLHFNDGNYQSGNVYVVTSDPAASGYLPGTIFLVREA
jgi:hypothetical protein